MRKAFSLLEILIAVAITLVVVAGLYFFFTEIIKSNLLVNNKLKMSLSTFQAVEIIDSDLEKAGYGIDNSTLYPPVEWNSLQKKLTIRYVDYDESGCLGEKFKDGKNNDCDYVIVYELKDGNIVRGVDKGADGTFAYASMFDPDVIEVRDFLVSIDYITRLVSYKLQVSSKGSTFIIGDSIICRNWH